MSASDSVFRAGSGDVRRLPPGDYLISCVIRRRHYVTGGIFMVLPTRKADGTVDAYILQNATVGDRPPGYDGVIRPLPYGFRHSWHVAFEPERADVWCFEIWGVTEASVSSPVCPETMPDREGFI